MKELGNSSIASRPMAKAWQAAASDLGIRFISPFALEIRGCKFLVSGWLPEFGGPKGTIIFGRHSPDEAFEVADELGYHTSGLNPRYYEQYNRARFIEALRDWGWTGDPAQLPIWYARSNEVGA